MDQFCNVADFIESKVKSHLEKGNSGIWIVRKTYIGGIYSLGVCKPTCAILRKNCKLNIGLEDGPVTTLICNSNF